MSGEFFGNPEFFMRWRSVGVPAVVAVGLFAACWAVWLRGPRAGAVPLPVPDGDREVAFLHVPTSFETWENFVWGVKRAEMPGDGGPDGLEVDDSGAFPDRTTAVPEVVIRRKGHAGSLRVRWYKLTDEATQEAWVASLARRDPAPLAVVGGWSSDRAKVLADAMRGASWPGQRPLLFLSTATADVVYPDDDNPSGDRGPTLISLYDRSFRFCFTNSQMAESVTDFVLSDPTLRPGPVGCPGLRAVGGGAAGAWAGLAGFAAEVRASGPPVPAYAVAWKDDPYSTDLEDKFRDALRKQGGPSAGLPRLDVTIYHIPFSTGRLNRPNRAEAETAEDILANLPPPGTRTVLVIPTVSAPARRTLRALVQGEPDVGRRVVAVTGDGISVNTIFRDREFAWPVRSIPVPVVLFTHADPLGWDRPGVGAAPPGYELVQPKPGEVRSSTEDIRSFTRMTRIVAAGAFPDGSADIVPDPDTLAARLRALTPPFFDAAGDRLSRTGEHVVVLRPTFPRDSDAQSRPDAVLEVYARRPGTAGWVRAHARPLGRPTGGAWE